MSYLSTYLPVNSLHGLFWVRGDDINFFRGAGDFNANFSMRIASSC